MRVGVVLPTFTASAAPALEAAREAEAEGIHGVFAYDHLWPMGRPLRPALSSFPLLGAVAASTSSVMLGPLVARVGTVADDLLVSELLTLDTVSAGRLVAAIGTGDRKSLAEMEGYGVPRATVASRRGSLARVASAMLDAGVEAWIGGGSAATNAVARATDAALNLWAAPAEVLAAAAGDGEVTWGGVLPPDPAAAAGLLGALAGSGASWAVLGWPGSLGPVVAAARAAGIELGR